MGDHAKKTPPSAADRWMFCTASVPLIVRLMEAGELKESDLEGESEDISEDDLISHGSETDAYEDVVLLRDGDTTSYSAEGDVMHVVRAMALEFGTDPLDYEGVTLGSRGFNFELTEDMLDRLVPGIDWIRQHELWPLVEIRVNLDPWLPGQFGTCDTAFVTEIDGKTYLVISDYKNGIGKPVAADGNRQLRIYALGVWHHLGRPKIDMVLINIDQPRAGGMKFWSFPFGELLEFGEELKRVWERIESGNVEFVPTTSGCQFCPVKKTARGCAAYNQWMLLMFGSDLLDLSNPQPSFRDPAQLPRAHRYYIVKHAKDIRAWLAKLYDESLNAALRGDPDPGSKAVEGDSGRRCFATQEARKEAEYRLVMALGAQAYKPPQLIGFTEMDRLVKPGRKKLGHPEAWEALQNLVSQPAGKPKLVPEDHPRPAISKLADDDDFEDL